MSARAHPLWVTQKERGSTFLMATIATIALRVGRPAAAALLYPICAYFLLFSVPARAASRDYLARVLGRPPRWRERFHHYHVFAATILDRVFLYAGRTAKFRLEVHGADGLRALLAGGRGCLLFGAHFGSFEVLRALGLSESPVPVRVLMHDRHAEKLARVLHALNAELPAQIIPLGRPQTMLDVRDALARGEIVSLLADRSLHGEREVACPFLGGTARFPRGPFELAALLGAPVVLFSATYQGPRRYAVRFELVEDAHCAGFAAWLEARCREAPFNWFNFYDFWALDGRPAP
jgi:predicted LPLAT superfamily acyltransferase